MKGHTRSLDYSSSCDADFEILLALVDKESFLAFRPKMAAEIGTQKIRAPFRISATPPPNNLVPDIELLWCSILM